MGVSIRVQNLNLKYSGSQNGYALKNINIDIPKNKLTSIIGPSGCGKTTLLKALNRLHDLNEGIEIEGQIMIGDEDINHPTQPLCEIRKKVGLIAQRPYPLPANIYDNVAAGPRLHRRVPKLEMDGIVEDCLRRTHLWDEVKDRLKSPAVELSIGQQQRLCIARALAVEPEVILCDESTSALDPISSKRIEELLLSLKDRYTIVLVSHVLRQAKRLSDHLVFMYFGEVVEAGSAAEFFGNPKDERLKNYISGIMAG